MNNQAAQMMAQARGQIVSELNIGHLTQEEQDKIIEGVGEILFKKVMLKIYSLLPLEAQEKMSEFLESDTTSEDAVRALVQQHIPESEKVIAAEIRAGLDEYKLGVAKIVAERQLAGDKQ